MAEFSFADLRVGMTSSRTYQFTEERVASFANLVDDRAPVHTNVAFARQQGFDGRIVYGLFVHSVLSGMLGSELPGARSVINSLSMKMHSPVHVGQTVRYQLEITALTPAVAAVSLSFSGTIEDQIVISGKALCSFPKHG